jgi:hypothetical protein
MFTAFLIAQLAGPWCNSYGVTVENSGSIGCTTPGPLDGSAPYGYRLKADPYSPSGIRVTPAGPSPLPQYLPPSQP